MINRHERIGKYFWPLWIKVEINILLPLGDFYLLFSLFTFKYGILPHMQSITENTTKKYIDRRETTSFLPV